jgi:hypothetical protein
MEMGYGRAFPTERMKLQCHQRGGAFNFDYIGFNAAFEIHWAISSSQIQQLGSAPSTV